MEQKITLVVTGKEIVFAPNQTAYNKFINEMAMDNKVAPAHNYLTRIVEPESKDALAELLKTSGCGVAAGWQSKRDLRA